MIKYIILIIIILLVLYFLLTYNSFVKLKNQVKEAFSTMDVYLKKRWDLIPNLIEVVKGYAKHEKNTLEEVTKLRSKSYESMSTKEKINTNEAIVTELSKIIALKEAYPELKSNENFLDLQKELKQVENEIEKSRKYYNGAVRLYNNKVEMFPSKIIANILGYTTEKMFEIDDSERKNIKIKL